MELREIVETHRTLRATRSRREKVAHLARTLRALAPDEVPVGVAWLAGSLPQGRIRVGGATLRAARAAAPAPRAGLTLGDVDAAFEALARLEGPGSGAARRERLGALFSRATQEEQAFLTALALGELRQGASEGLMAEGVAAAARVPVEAVRRALMRSGDLGAVARAALAEGADGLARFAIALFRPVRPMLAQPADDPEAALGRLGEAAFEWKLDGARVQIHREGADVAVYSRRLHDVSAAVPEVVEAVRALPGADGILDGEVLALRADGRPHPFQTTMRRFGRRLDVPRLRAELPLSLFVFDCLRAEGEDLTARPGAERHAALRARVPQALRVPRRVTADAAEARAFAEDALARGHEGLMAKSLHAPYEAGGRGFAWLKLKPAHTLDLVVLAAEWGSGRRRGWLSNLHLGARDPEGGPPVMVGKTFKGLTDAVLAWQTGQLLARATRREGHVVHVAPELVVEVAVSGVQTSPRYPAGLALRFARVRHYRPDKDPAEADTVDAVRALRDAGG